MNKPQAVPTDITEMTTRELVALSQNVIEELQRRVRDAGYPIAYLLSLEEVA